MAIVLIQPFPKDTDTPGDVYAKKVARLKKVCDEAYEWPDAAKACNKAVYYVITHLIDEKFPLRTAKGLIEDMKKGAPWKEVTLEEGWKLANQGIVVVGGKTGDNNGHVVVIYPGDKTRGGGYEYQQKDKTGKLRKYTMRSHGLFPRCLSRSSSSWPGGVSKGDKNVFDPWGKDDVFKQVKYWTMNKP